MRIKRIITALSAAVLMLSPIPTAVHASDEMMPSRVKVTEIESKVKETLEDKKYPSLGTAIFTKDEILYSGYFGNIDQEEGIPAGEDSVYDWGSITKTLTWVSVMQLYEQGKIDLNADIRTYLPDGFLRHLKYDDSITMMNLMNHTSGWCETTYSIYADDEKDITDLAAMLQDVEPAQMYRPGEVNTYSNFGTALAGYIVERVSGEDYIDYVNAHIFTPLGMEHTSIAPAYTDNEWVRERSLKLKGYASNPVNGDVVYNGIPRAYIKIYPCGSACGTVADFVKFGQAMLDESAPLFEKPETQKMMYSGSLFTEGTDIMVNSYGLWCNHRNVETLWHDGGTAQGTSEFEFEIESGYGIITMINGSAGAEIAYTLPEIVFGKDNGTDAAEQEITEREDISGKYISTRSCLKGVMKGLSYGNALAGQGISEIKKADDDSFYMETPDGKVDIKRIGNGLYRVSDKDTSHIARIKELSDGSMILCNTGNDLVRDNNAYIKGILAVYYIYAGVFVFLLFIIKVVLKGTRKLKPYAGSKIILAAQIAKFTVFLFFIVINIICRLGITKPAGIVWCALNVLCGAICASAVISDIKCLFSRSPEKGKAWRYILNIIFNVITVAAVIWLELYCFWGC